MQLNNRFVLFDCVTLIKIVIEESLVNPFMKTLEFHYFLLQKSHNRIKIYVFAYGIYRAVLSTHMVNLLYYDIVSFLITCPSLNKMFSFHILVQLDNGHLMLLQDNFSLLSLYPQDLQIFAILTGLQIL